MPSKIVKEIILAKLTNRGDYKYPWIEKKIVSAIFTKNMNTCYVDDLTLKKIKGGGDFGGNYQCETTEDEYRISV